MDTLKIKGKLREKGLTYKDVASPTVWNCALPTVSQKLTGKRPLYLDEANKLAKLLNLTEAEYFQYFFAKQIA